MTAADLTSAVFVLRPQTHFAPRQFLGRMAHKLFLAMLNHVGNETLAASLHAHNATLPYTVSDVFANGQRHYWMRVSGLTPFLSSVLYHLCNTLPGQVVDVPGRTSSEKPWKVTVETVLISHHEWASNLIYADFVREAWQPPKHSEITLEFLTPTQIESVGVQRPFPLPELVFRLLYERLLKLDGLQLPFQPDPVAVEAYLAYYIEIRDYNVTCITRLPLKDEEARCFRGWITYHLLNANNDFCRRADNALEKTNDGTLASLYSHIEQHITAYASLAHLLGQFVFFSGIGKHTGQGMGMVRQIDSPLIKPFSRS